MASRSGLQMGLLASTHREGEQYYLARSVPHATASFPAGSTGRA